MSWSGDGATRTVTYEVTLKERGYRPEPYAVADALMYADGKPIVEITNMSVRFSGLTRERLRTYGRAGGVSPLISARIRGLTPPARRLSLTMTGFSRSPSASHPSRSASRIASLMRSGSSPACRDRRC